MRNTLKPRKDLDDADTPAFVREPDRKVPICCRCGREVPYAKSLWTLCEYCINQGLEIPATPTPRHPQGTHAMIGDLARAMALRFTTANGDHSKIPPASVLHHAERFRARGLDEHAATRLAESLVTDPVHRSGCVVCQGNREEIAEKIERPRAEVARLAGIGRQHLPRLRTR